MESDFKEKMNNLTAQLEVERKRKADLDRELNAVNNELDSIETDFPDKLNELKSQIATAK